MPPGPTGEPSHPWCLSPIGPLRGLCMTGLLAFVSPSPIEGEGKKKNRVPPARPVLLNYQKFDSAKFLINRYQGGCDGRMGAVKNGVGLVKGV